MSAIFESLFGLTLRDPAWLLLALLVPFAWWFGIRPRGPALRFAPGRFVRGPGGPLPRSWRVTLLPTPAVLAVLGLLCVVVALARPAARERVPVASEGLDILLCVDTSSSMSANDMDGARTRLAIARDEAARFVAGRPHDRVGLLSFARYPDVRCPLTLDHAALTRILADVETVSSDGPEDATGIGAAVARAAEVLDGSGARSRVVILLTDGAENVALAGVADEIPPSHAAQLCERLGVRVYPIALGAVRSDASRSAAGPDTQAVERMAVRTGGVFHVAQDAGAVASVYERIDELETAPIEAPRYVFDDRYVGILIAGLVLLLAGALLGATVWSVLP